MTITGTEFNPDPASNIVWFGGVKGTVTAASPTELSVMVPVGAGFGPITVTSDGQSVISKQAFGVTFAASNTVSSTSFPSHPGPMTHLENTNITRGAGHLVDLDGDGKPDLVHVITGSNGGISIFRNIHTGGPMTAASFAARQDILTGSNPRTIQVADLDADGKPDLIVYNPISFTITILRNTSTVGTISFDSQTIATGNTSAYDQSQQTAIGDVDGDGLMDIVIAGYISSPHGNWLTVFRNTSTPGTMTFAAGQRFSMAYPTYTLIAADFDGDGKADVAYTYRGSTLPTQLMVVMRSTSTPGVLGFAAAQTFVTSSNYPWAIAAGDLNGDGLPEAVVSLSNFSLNVFPNTSTPGTISFGTRQDLPAAEAGSYDDIRFADVDGDGKPELLYTASVSNHSRLMVFPNTSTGGSVSMGPKQEFNYQESSAYYNVHGMAVGDADLDGKTDVILMTNSRIGFFENRVGSAEFSGPASNHLGYGFESNEVEFDWVLSNPGTLPLTISSISSSNPALQIHPTSTVIEAGASQTFTIQFLTDDPGTHEAELTFVHDAPSRISVVDLSIEILETPPPPIVLTEATGITNTSFTIQWQDVLGADQYLVDVSTSPTFESFLEGFESAEFSGSGVVVTGLTDGATYHYRVSIVDELGNHSQPSTSSVQLLSYFAGGKGTVDFPYLVATAQHLDNVRLFRSAHFRQTQPVTIGNWTPLSTGSLPFTGTYDGQHHPITGLTLDGNFSITHGGLFGQVSGADAVIRNLVLLDVYVNGTVNAGSVAGLLNNGAQLLDSFAEGEIRGGSASGGLVGRLESAHIRRSYASVDVSLNSGYGGNTFAGGLVGYVTNGTIENSYSFGFVFAYENVGGIAGMTNNTTLVNVYSIAEVSSSQPDPQYTGGLVGDYIASAVINSYWSLSTSEAGGVGTGLTDAQLRNPASFVGWDFESVWASGSDGANSFPYLRSFPQTPPLGLNTAPNMIGLIAPSNAYMREFPNPTFSWYADNSAETYELEIATDAAFSTLVRQISELETTTHVLAEALDFGTTYYWRVRGYNPVSDEWGDWSAVRSFRTYTVNPPLPGHALAFDGINDFVSIPSLTNLSGNAITIEYWFKGSNLQSAVRQQSGSGYISAGWAGAQKLHILSNDGGLENGLPVGQAEDGTWHHVAMTWERNTTNGFKSYLDGVLVAQRTSADAPIPNLASPVSIGAISYGGQYANGRIDEVRIWNVARTQTQIRESMHQVFESPQTGLLLNLSFPEGSGSVTDYGIGELYFFGNTQSSGWVISDIPVGGTSEQFTAVQSGTLSGGTLELTITESFDTPVDVSVTSIPLSPNQLPDVETPLEDAYWIVETFGSAGSFTYSLEFSAPSEFIQEGNDLTLPFKLYHRDARSTGEWVLLKNGASDLTETTISFDDISVTGQFALGFRPVVTGIQANVSPLAFGTVNMNLTQKDTILIQNIGDTEVEVTSIASSQAAFTVTPASMTIPVGGQAQVVVTFQPTVVQAYSANLTLTHDADGSPLVIPLTGVGTAIHPGNAFQFTEASGFHYLEIPDATHPTQYTIEAWVRPTAAGAMSILTRTNAAGPNLNYAYTLRINAAGKFEHYTYASAGATVSGTTTVELGKWYHVAGVFTSDKQVQLFVNGVQEGTMPVMASTPWDGGTRYLVGVDHASGAFKKFTGQLDELRLWHVARTGDQIRNGRTHVLDADQTGLVGYWRFDEASGSALNRMGANRTATVVGNPVRVSSTAPVQAPVVGMDSAPIAFGYYGSSPNNRTVNVQNSGSHPLTIHLADDVPGFSVAPAELSVQPGQTGNFTVTFEPETNSVYEGTLVFTHNASSSSIQIPVSGTGLFTPTTPASNLQVNVTGPTSAIIKWTPGNGSRRLVQVFSGTHAAPANNTTYALSSTVVYNGTGVGDSVEVESLVDFTTYTVRIYEYDGPDGVERYNTTSVPSTTFLTEKHTAADPGTALELAGGHLTLGGKTLNQLGGSGMASTKSVTLWVRPEGTGPAFAVAYNGRGIITDNDGYWGIYQTTVAGADRIWVYNYDGSADVVGIPYTSGEWMHVALVHSGGTLRAYKNGVLVGSVSSGNTSVISHQVRIGIGYNQNQLFSGGMDDFAIWKTALTEENLKRIMFQPPTGSETELAAYWTMDEGNGTRIYDRTPNGHTATISGAGSFTADIPPMGAFIHGTQSAWYLLSNPNPETTLAEFLAPLWTQGAVGSDSPNAGNSNVFELDESTGSYRAVTDLTVDATPGKGWLVWVYKNDVYGVEGSFPKRLEVPRPPSPENIDLATTHTPASLFSGFNLVGNPFPRAIDWAHTGWTMNGVTSSVYVYDQSINNYRTWNRTLGTGTNGGSRYIAPLQGFLVETTTAEAVLRIPAAATVHTAATLFKDLMDVADPLPTLNLSLNASGREEQTSFVFHRNADDPEASHPTRQLEPMTVDRFMIYSVRENGDKVDVAEFPRELTGYMDVPIQVEASIRGTLGISMTTATNIDEQWDIVLHDRLTDTFTDLRAVEEYRFDHEGTLAKSRPDSTLEVPAMTQSTSAEDARFRVMIGIGVPRETPATSPETFTLSQNFPNPFNPSTQIRFTLGTQDLATLHTRLTVYDVLGREVAVLVNGEMPVGAHQVTFDASSLASGMYLYRLTAGGQVITRRMMLVK